VSKILVFNVPAHGHVNPTLPVVRELVSRGAHVAYYLTDEFEPQIRHTGAEFRRIEDIQPGSGPPPGVTALGQTDPAMMRQMMAAFFPRMMADGLRLVPRLIDRVRAEDADCVVYDPFCPWGRALVGILGLPAVAFVPSYAMTEHFPLVRRLSTIFEEQTSPEAEEAMSDFRDVSRQLHDRYGLAPLRPGPATSHGSVHYCRGAERRHPAAPVSTRRRHARRALRVRRPVDLAAQ